MVQRADIKDCRILSQLAVQMWDGYTEEELENGFMEEMESGKTAFFIKYASSQPVGFAQCGLRHDYVEGTETSPVGYLEGIFVEEEYRENGYAKEMLRLNLANCRALGIKRVLLCCDHDNIASERTILANGGVFERTTEANGKTVKRYWIDIYD